jgi:diaminopimelate decarboxylase
MKPVSLPQHPEISYLKSVDDCLYFGNMSLPLLVQQVGHTPFYAYDRGLLTERVSMLRNLLPKDILLHYAVKANPMPALVQHMAGLVDGLDVASNGEMRVALNTGVSPKNISFAGPGKTFRELSCAILAKIIINIESENEMKAVATLARRYKIRPSVAIRVNPDFELKTSGMKMGGGPKQFGVDAERVPAMLKRLNHLDLDFIGFHIFSGSQNLRVDAIQECQEKTIRLAIKLAEYTPSPVRLVNIGGGLGIPYFPGDKPLNLRPIGDNLYRLLLIVNEYLPQAQIVMELGRYLVGEAGIYVCKVIDRKISRGQVYLITDGGLHHHLAASGNFGQIIRKNYPVLVGNKVTGSEREIVSVVGPLCTPLDLLADKMEMAKAEIGDFIVILQSGAYGLTASPTQFLNHPTPAELLV